MSDVSQKTGTGKPKNGRAKRPSIMAYLFGVSARRYNPKLLWRRLTSGSWSARLAFVLMCAAVIAGAATYAALRAAPPFGNNPDTVIWLLNIDLIIMLLLVTLIARRLVNLWSGRKKNIAGSRLHVRLVFVFGFLAAAPAILMTVFAAFFLHFGMQSWFSDRVHTAVTESEAVAEAYLEEHLQLIRVDTMAMANDIDRQASLLILNPSAFNKVVQTQSLLRNLSEAVVFDSSGRVLAKSGLTFTLAFESIPSYAISSANQGDAVVMTGANDDRVRALVKLNSFVDGYLFVGRMVDQTVLSHVTDTRKAVQEYQQLEGQRSGLQVKITMMFLVVAMLLLFAAIWFGLIFARQMILPISALITAAEKVRAGDLSARVLEFERQDEFDVLAKTFNRMTSQIQEQRNELITANEQLDQRRRFTEMVLAGVSSGIIGVDSKGKIRLTNASAAELFQQDADDLSGHHIDDIFPDMAPLLEQAQEKPNKFVQAEVPFVRGDNSKRNLLVRIAIEDTSKDDKGAAVLTFDDITELQSAQRKAAWADVARRIAHEIKNPLTPIQLSAERLKKRYLKQIKEDPDIFSQCTDTIIHHVGDIGRMVNEFSSFARMPEPVMKQDNLTRHIRDMLVLQQQAHPDIQFTIKEAGIFNQPLQVQFDAQQIRQALTNIVQNAIEAIENDKNRTQGQINILLTEKPDTGDAIIIVSDSGPGLPQNEDVLKLTEPYITHKIRGTGLGLAIVKKIMEDHNGKLVLGTPDWLKTIKEWENIGGATVSLILPVDGSSQENSEEIELRQATQ